MDYMTLIQALLKYQQAQNNASASPNVNQSPPSAPSPQQGAPAQAGNSTTTGSNNMPVVGPAGPQGQPATTAGDPDPDSNYMNSASSAPTTNTQGLAAAGAISALGSQLQNTLAHPALVQIGTPPPAPAAPNFQPPTFGSPQLSRGVA